MIECESYSAKVLLEHPSLSIGFGSFTWMPAPLARNSRMMTLSTLRLGNGWNKARVGSNRFTAQKSDACPKSLDVRFIRVASHAKDVIKHV